jgi:hypothetical protein
VTAASALLATLLAAGCTDINGSLVVIQAQVPAEGCKVPAERSKDHLDQGTLDVALDRDYPYILYPLVASRLEPIKEEGDIEPNRIQVTGARVRIEPPPGIAVTFSDACPREFDVPSQLSLDPKGEGTLGLEVIRSCHAALFRKLFDEGRLNSSVAERIYFRTVVRIKGRHGSSEMLSDPFDFPVRVCFGCLQVGFTPPYSMFNFPQTPPCSMLADNPFLGNTCNPAQDSGPILCCSKDGSATSLQCPGTPAGRVTTPPKP